MAILWQLSATPAERREDLAVELAGVGLAGDRDAAGETQAGGDARVELADLAVIAGEEGRGSSPGCRSSP